ncbi:SRPBCC family protein [Leekyejoonella antrihumi]|uniref:SRPBCC family protein n=1 Tax=Leekyejoonella antrihumi TaxID=1660198 RepID=A0A563DY17_9MICO|nr:SRPBCC family protein [Leekyejoonella antrihumi]TWP35168.1 SRPBCC family protein [Leekyejoonella antrihumi]
MPQDLQASIDIDAPPSDVWSVVHDLTRMPEWSPQCRRVLARGPIRQGSRMINLNRAGWKVWPTRSVVTDFDEGRTVGFRVADNNTRWVFDLEGLDDGARTRLIERRDVSDGTTAISRRLIDTFLGGEQEFEKDLLSGIRQTLAGIKQTVEST